MSRTMARTSGRAALASATVKYFLPVTGLLTVILYLPPPIQAAAAARCRLRPPRYFLAAFSGAGGSGDFVHTGSGTSLEAATAVGFRVAWPHATSNGSLAKSTMQPSRL